MSIKLNHEGIGMTSRRTRERMVRCLIEQGIGSAPVLQAMTTIPRHVFVDEALASRAYEQTALPIGHSQTISQPYIVGRMTELLIEQGAPRRVLEVGTGSGYQTALLAELAGQVYSVERILPLQLRARRQLYELGYRNISFKHSDGGCGWAEHAPYEGILVAAAATEIPQSLLEQLSVGGVMVLPVGGGGQQVLQRVTRTESRCEVETLERVSFVPLLAGMS